MKTHLSIQLKAALLLVVFALNTLVGFACAVGVDMGFNTKHDHHEQEETVSTVYVHADGKQHTHQHPKQGHGQHQHHPSQQQVGHHTPANGKDDCCNDSVVKLEQTDKSVASIIGLLHPVFFTAFLAAFHHVPLLPPVNSTRHNRYFVRSHHPPIPDIRIAIQSFQI